MNDQTIMEGLPPIEENALAAAAENVASEEAPAAPGFFDERPRRSRRGRGKRGNKNFEPRNQNQEQTDSPDNEPLPEAASDNTNPDAQPQQGREDRDRGPRRRPRRWRDKREHRPDQTPAGSAQENNAGSPAPTQTAVYNPAPQSAAPSRASAPPPLDQQAPQDGKPKKGWWRRIVEA
jgi:hypothetical protein